MNAESKSFHILSKKYQSRNELLLYLVMWLIIFVADIYATYVRFNTGTEPFEWHYIIKECMSLGICFVLFWIHNFFIAPLLVYHNQPVKSSILLGLLVVIFIAWQSNTNPEPPHDDNKDSTEMHSPPPEDKGISTQHFFRPRPPKHGKRPPRDLSEPRFFTEHIDLMTATVFILMIGLNVTVKYYFRFSDEKKRYEALEKQNLQRQLDYLKYQINPHFFMNTLNNIHALVDIDAEKAKQSIVELSRLMRFMLYEGSNRLVALQKEIDFMRNYVRIMQMRYSEGVEISFNVDAPVPDRQIAPLIMITFIENAFKHGISYRKHSYVRINISFPSENELLFVCSNSKVKGKDDSHGGVGLNNVRQRLDLIYENRYTLNLTDGADEYRAELKLSL